MPPNELYRDSGIVRLADVALQPGAAAVLYNRVSSWGQAGKGKCKLADKDAAVYRQLREIANPDELRLRRAVVSGVEKGQLSEKRPKLREAIQAARQYGAILIASDLSRFIRAEAYSRRTNIEAWPTVEEFDQLRELADGVTLATLLDPTLSESERHSLATKRTGVAGRPPEVDFRTGLRILEWREAGESLGAIAGHLDITKSKVQRFLDDPVPGHDGLRWKDLETPAWAYRRTYPMSVPDRNLMADFGDEE